ncbi:MAG: replication protein [Deltaproteobacteria bacterium]|nr:replication protein [Deltaproteobacteria bacterium]
MPHAVSEVLQRIDFSSRQFRILVTILRETIGWGREYAELSAKDLSKRTGIASSHIFITLRELEDLGAIIRRVNGKNAKNSYALNRGFFVKSTKRQPEPEEGPTNTGSVPDSESVLTTTLAQNTSSDPVHRTEYQNGATLVPISSQHSDEILRLKKQTKKLKNSPDRIPAPLLGLLAGIRPEAKQESERQCALKLLAEYSAEDLTAAVSYLHRNGILGTRERCHSPFKYLMSAAEQVLAQVRQTQDKSLPLVSNIQVKTTEPSQAYEEALPLFESQLSEETKQQQMAQYVSVEFPNGFLPPQRVLRRLVAFKWFKEQGSAATEGYSVDGCV